MDPFRGPWLFPAFIERHSHRGYEQGNMKRLTFWQTAIGNVLFLLVSSNTQAGWTSFPLPVANGGTAIFTHLSDGRFVYANGGDVYQQDLWGGGAYSPFASSISGGSYASFIDTFNDTNALVGLGSWPAGDILSFDPEDTNSLFVGLGLTLSDYDGVINSASSFFLAGLEDGTANFPNSTSIVSYLTVTGLVRKTVIDDISAASGGLALDAAGNLYVGNGDDGEVRRFSAAQLSAAISGSPLAWASGTLIHDFGSGGNVGNIAVDAWGQVYATGYLHNGIKVFNPAYRLEQTIIPGFTNTAYRVGSFDAGGSNYVAYVNLSAGFTAGASASYGYDQSVNLWVTPEPFAESTNGIHHSIGGISGWITDVISVHRPDANSGGLAFDNNSDLVSPQEAVAGPPTDFLDLRRHAYSLGNGGNIVLGFDAALEDRPGPDFAVFENALLTDPSFFVGTPREGDPTDYIFAELAFVEVGTTTSAWARFPVTYYNQDPLYAVPVECTNQFSSQDVTLIDGLAGKHLAAYGTPFDLGDLADHPAVINGTVDLREIHYIRLVDVPGDGTVLDDGGRPIYDPFFSAFNVDAGECETNLVPAPTSGIDGFDLRGIAALHFQQILETPSPDTMEVFAVQDREYQLQYRENLLSGTWENEGGVVTGAQAVVELSISNRTDASGYFRITERTP
jgi:hypothetical protein